MNLLQITDLGDGYIQLSWQRGNTLPRPYAHPIPFSDPMSDTDRTNLRWYLEQFLGFPYGAERDRAQKIEHKMEQWGRALFRQVFTKAEVDPDPHAYYQEAVRQGLDNCQLCITSDAPPYLTIPWELLRAPPPGVVTFPPPSVVCFASAESKKSKRHTNRLPKSLFVFCW